MHKDYRVVLIADSVRYLGATGRRLSLVQALTMLDQVRGAVEEQCYPRTWTAATGFGYVVGGDSHRAYHIEPVL